MAVTETSSHPYLSGNYAPVADEIEVFDLPVRGAIPEALSGRYLRTGPNPHGAPPEPYHWFLGDGMIHGIELRGGSAASYRNRWVRTSGIGDSPVEGPAQPMYDASNTNVIGFNGRILSLTEGCYPYELSPSLDTLRRTGFGGELPHGMTAHPKIDPVTGELHGFSYWFTDPHLIYHVVDATGQLVRTVPIDLPRAISMHDFALTRNHVLFFDQPYIFDLAVAAEQGFPFRWAPEFGSRLGILPRTATSGDEIRWIDTAPVYSFHPLNAYETDAGELVVDLPTMDAIGGGSAPAPVDMRLERWTVDLATNQLRADTIDDTPQEFSRINESRLGSLHRYGYFLEADGPTGPYGSDRVFKHDLAQRTRQEHAFGAGRNPGEFVFVSDPDRSGDEDGGWLMGLVYDAAADRSELVILDAQDFAGDEIATVTMPRRIPYGFHGNWVADS
jgi:carotenoid cleavage oxygenase